MYEYHGNKGSRRQQEIKEPLTLYRAGGFLFISCRRYQTDHLQIYSGGVRILNVQLGGYNPDPMPGNDGAQGRGYTPNPTSGFGEEQRKSFTPNPGTGFASDDDDGNDATVMLRDDGSEATILLKARVKPNATLIRLHTQEKFHITTEICKIGKRALMVDICIRNNPTISREHCAIHFEEGKYYLEDKDSSNYTYLNGNRAMPGQKLLLNDGDQIRLSDEEFIFRKGDVK